jgi:hypothetical protein
MVYPTSTAVLQQNLGKQSDAAAEAAAEAAEAEAEAAEAATTTKEAAAATLAEAT